MKHILVVISLGILIVGCARDHRSGAGAVGTESGRISGSSGTAAPEEASFALEACRTEVTETEIGKLAASNTKNKAVRNLAKRLVKEHTQAEKELEQLFARKGLPRGEAHLAEQLQSSINDLARLKGAAFDRAFKQQVIAEHEKAIESFEHQAKQGADPDLKAFAEKYLLQLRTHLIMAQELDIDSAGDERQEQAADRALFHNALKGPGIQTPSIQK